MIFQYSMPGNKLKEEFIDNLNRILAFDHFLEFNELLKSSHFLATHYERMVSEDSDLLSYMLELSDTIFKELKDFLANSSVDVLIEKLSVVMRNKMEPIDESNLRSVLTETNNPVSLEYLKRLTSSFEHVSKLYCRVQGMSGSFGSVNDLGEFIKFVSLSAFNCTMTILTMMFQIYLDEVEVSEEEKCEWRRLLFEAAPVLKKSIVDCVGMNCARLPYFLQMRSCVQYVLDLFSECPEKYADESKKLDNITDLKDYYDGVIESLLGDDFGYDSDCESCFKKKIIEEVNSISSLVPPTHKWWKEVELRAG